LCPVLLEWCAEPPGAFRTLPMVGMLAEAATRVKRGFITFE
jgi:hypothetical protein